MVIRRLIPPTHCTWHASKLVDKSRLLVNSSINVDDLLLEQDVISSEDEKILVEECDFRLKRRRYERNHWDDVIIAFKEFETTEWSRQSSEILDRIRQSSLFTQHGPSLLPSVHVIDLAPDGFIRPHIDSIKFSGSVVAGLSLLSERTMRFQHEDSILDVSLPPRSLYLMTGSFRYRYTHEILTGSERRMSIIFRNPKLLN